MGFRVGGWGSQDLAEGRRTDLADPLVPRGGCAQTKF